MSSREYPTVDYLRQCFEYRDGKLFWLERPREHFPRERTWKFWNSLYSGREAGYKRTCKNGDVRWRVCVARKNLYRCHLVWILHGREMPAEIDHRNRDPLDDRIENLRPATRSQNLGNRSLRRDCRSGLKGAFYDSSRPGTRKWRSEIRVNHRIIRLGYYATPEDAHAAYCEAARKHFGEFACDGERAIT